MSVSSVRHFQDLEGFVSNVEKHNERLVCIGEVGLFIFIYEFRVFYIQTVCRIYLMVLCCSHCAIGRLFEYRAEFKLAFEKCSD